MTYASFINTSQLNVERVHFRRADIDDSYRSLLARR